MKQVSNEVIADKIKMLSKLMDLHNENAFKSKSYNNAAFQIDKCKTEIVDMQDTEILALPGIGSSVLKTIREIVETGTIKELDELLAKTPIGILDIMNIKGLGPKKVSTIWKNLEIESIGELFYACQENRLTDLKGFGEKTQNEVIKFIQFMNQNQHKFFYSEGLLISEILLQLFNEQFEAYQFEITGEIRRKDIVIERIEFITTIENELEIIECLESLNEISNISFNEDEMIIYCNYLVRFPIKIWMTNETEITYRNWKQTSTVLHLNQLPEIEKKYYTNEVEIYSQLNMQYIEPELRNGLHEIELAKQNIIPNLVTEIDIKGVLHCHSKYSDGKNTLKEMAVECMRLGYEYLGITDHSQSATYADGLKPDRIFEQHEEINNLNKELFPFKIYKGIESDILYNGNLDYDEEVLQSFDFIIASIHSTLKMNEDTAMKRLIRAIENPYTTILGHLTGRLLLSRDAYPINHKKIIDACSANNVIIELNANPHRLDIDWQWINYATEKNVMIAINPDAHSLGGINDIKYGIAAARKGMLTANNCLNALSQKDFEHKIK